jgi:hypothetical protein
MVIDITELITVKQIPMLDLVEWLNDNKGNYFGTGSGIVKENYLPIKGHSEKIHVLYIGKGWEIQAKTIVDSYGRTILYFLDIDDGPTASFFILKWS